LGLGITFAILNNYNSSMLEGIINLAAVFINPFFYVGSVLGANIFSILKRM